MKPSCFKISAILSVTLDARVVTFSFLARTPFRIIVRKSAIGSVGEPILSLSPARFFNAWKHAPYRKFTEADSAELKLPNQSARTPAYIAAVIRAHGKLRRFFCFINQTCFRHCFLYFLNGKPKSSSNSFDSFLSFVDVTKVISMPCVFLIFSNSTSGNINCSLRPNE